MKHDSETLMHADTKVVTRHVSYDYECAHCKKVFRYAYPPFGWGVFCDGKEFRTQKRKDPIAFKMLNIGLPLKINDFLQRLIRKIFKRQIGTPAHVYNLVEHYGEEIAKLPFGLNYVALEEGDMFTYGIMNTLWKLEDDGIVKRIEGSKYKATDIGSVVLSRVYKIWQ